ncbi:MAG: hypothetical protein IPJ89_02640 [Candidatus Iainarchaeum archaeon]|uniref:Uncharacterized protein n=1 Tax=Candidatus Iainarchaeum sp. TaxID=3101447 RepID=A0A7T9I2T7_9ARCH|nr:MAG: hypothetical protein IPJ89_02640 [Candidatus Diapherotrites archaeon]
MKTKALAVHRSSRMEKVLAEIKSTHPDFVPNNADMSILRGLDDLIHGRVKEWSPKKKSFAK